MFLVMFGSENSGNNGNRHSNDCDYNNLRCSRFCDSVFPLFGPGTRINVNGNNTSYCGFCSYIRCSRCSRCSRSGSINEENTAAAVLATSGSLNSDGKT